MNPFITSLRAGSRRSRLARLACIFAIALIASCGKKGPLYLPDRDNPPAASGTQTVNPAPAPSGKQ